MAKKKAKEVKKPKPKEEEQIMDGLAMDFEEAMKKLAHPEKYQKDQIVEK
jgi:hypothetical protein